MRPPRPARIAIFVALAVLAALALFALDRSRGPAPVATSASRPTERAAQSAPSTTPTTPAPTTSTSTITTPTTVAERDPTYQVADTTLTIAAANRAGAPVTIPTTVWYPQEADGRTFPLVIFSPGYQISPSVYDNLITSWVSAGYVVAEANYPDTALGSPPVEYDMINHPAELGQVLHDLIGGTLAGAAPFQGLIDPSEVAVAGHSDGADVTLAAAADSCCTVPGIKAAIVMSGAEWDGFGGRYFSTRTPPLLAVQGAQDTINPPACSAQLYDGAPAPRYYLDLPTGTHKSPYMYAGPQQNVVEKVTTYFLDGYLKGITRRLDDLRSAGDLPGVSQLTFGAPMPVPGACPGAPGSG